MAPGRRARASSPPPPTTYTRGPGASSFSVTLSDPSEQSQTGPTETVIAQFPIDFIGAPPHLVPTFNALVDVDSGTATFNVRLAGTPDTADGDVIVTILKDASGAFELKSSLGPVFALPAAPALIKITAANDNAEASCRIRSKTVTLRAS